MDNLGLTEVICTGTQTRHGIECGASGSNAEACGLSRYNPRTFSLPDQDMTDRYAVIGNPIAHSKSPLIHRMFAQQTGQDISYEAIEAPLDGFAATVARLRAAGYKGCNVTVPFKFEAYQLDATQWPRQ